MNRDKETVDNHNKDVNKDTDEVEMKHDDITRTIIRGKESDNILSGSENNNNLDGLVKNTKERVTVC